MTREQAITKYVMPALKRTWNDNLCAEIEQALEQEPKIGHWKPTIVRGSKSYICSECSAECCYVTTNYCPSCGARMVEIQEGSEKE